MLKREDCKGIFASVPTLFTPTGEFDEQGFRENINRLCQAGIHAIQTTGGSGEFHTIDLGEHEKLTRALVEEADGRALTVVGCSALNTSTAIDRVMIAEACGADAALNLLPFYYGLNKSERIRYFEDLAGACPNIGLIHYNTLRQKVLFDGDDYRELVGIPALSVPNR